ncbi:PRTRC system protein B [Pedobacter aquatilis]|uniref:PRTRC system protein B n=1 Tax=Pedobacter aquatilis TaxID=351343 RepID=UPI0025B441A2|nr:PRTRC system protein B [Pedobacter aquatilis]MDN3588229.1 PRTRC system protein B [Pedobacter aquatilis]
MKDITQLFAESYLPVKALLFYCSNVDSSCYVESHDLDAQGRATNVHPLNFRECAELAEKLRAGENKKDIFLHHKSLLPESLLWYAPQTGGGAMWHTPKMKASLFFSSYLAIPDGQASLPPLLWKASKEALQVWALQGEGRPQADTPLFHAPFFNLYGDARVCMGNVRILLPKDCCLIEFISLWEKYFFASHFSHLLVDTSPVKMNIVQLWQDLINTGKDFPINQLKKSPLKLKNLLP